MGELICMSYSELDRLDIVREDADRQLTRYRPQQC